MANKTKIKNNKIDKFKDNVDILKKQTELAKTIALKIVRN